MAGPARRAGFLPGPIALFLFIFLWTPPHFWALALCRARDYDRVRVPMLPNVVGVVKTCQQILAYSVLLVASSFGALLIPGVGLFYAAIATAAGAVFLWKAVALYRLREAEEGPRRKAAMGLFGFSILYMFLVFAALLAQGILKSVEPQAEGPRPSRDRRLKPRAPGAPTRPKPMKNAVRPKSDAVRRRNNWIIFALAGLLAAGLYGAIIWRALITAH